MEKKIFKKHNSFEYFKKVYYLLIEKKMYNNFQIFHHRYIRISSILINNSAYVVNGLNFIKIKILLFSTGFTVGSFSFTKKNNKHVSFKKLKNQKR